MPTNRIPLNRQRTPMIDSETLRLFMELESTLQRRRESDAFKDSDRALHRWLGLGGEWMCDVCSVLDRSRKSYRTGYHHESWLKVRTVRLQLLEAAGMSEKKVS